MVNSKKKGKNGELEFVHYLKEYGIQARRGQQFKGTADSPDIICPDLPVHWEVKRTEKCNPYKYLEQAKSDGPVGKYPVVAHRQSRKEWIAILGMDDFMDLINTLKELQEK